MSEVWPLSLKCLALHRDSGSMYTWIRFSDLFKHVPIEKTLLLSLKQMGFESVECFPCGILVQITKKVFFCVH